jgi:hypothetical protein
MTSDSTPAPVLHRPQLIQRLLCTMLVLSFISGMVSGYYDSIHVAGTTWFDIASTILLLFLMLTWYHIDSNEHGYKRSMWLNIFILGFALFGIPYYVFRSRARGKRFAAMGWLLIFTLLFMGVNVGGEYLMVWMF